MMWRATGIRSLTTTHGASCAPPSLLRGSRSPSFHLAACRSSLQQQQQQQQQSRVRLGKLRYGRDVKQHTRQLLQEKGRLVRNCHEFGAIVNLRCCALQEPRSSAAIPESVGGGRRDEDGGFTSDSQETGSSRKLASAAAAAATIQESEEGGGPLLATSTANTSAPSTAAASYSAREIWAARAEDSIEKAHTNLKPCCYLLGVKCKQKTSNKNWGKHCTQKPWSSLKTVVGGNLAGHLRFQVPDTPCDWRLTGRLFAVLSES
jgi:hypothetical protein